MTVDELAEALARVGVDRRGVVTWDGAAVVRRGRRQPRLDGPALRARLVDRLRLVLYERLYCGVPDDDDELGAGLGHGADAWFVGRLSAAGTGVGGWQPGWHGVAVGPGGVTVRRHGLSVLARPGEVRRVDGGDAPLAPGMELALRFGPELPRALPGFWLTLGDAPVPDDEPLVRFYWHVAADAAPTLVRELTGRLNVARTPFQLKVVDHPGRYRRRDAAVLYVPAGAAVSAVAAVMAAHRRLGPATRPGVPAFTLPLARGLAVAEDTGEAASFGTHRCGLVAEAVVRVHERGSTAVRARLDAVGEVLAERGIDAARPWQRVLDLEHVRAAATAAGSARTVHLGPVHGPDAPAAPVAHGDGRAPGAGRRSGNGR
ncbi:hypothetical protein ICW40_10325, partial [Actinotalea ferrariae]|uniref:T3SS effector HopA1 family protein n=1 Tax=Actinotalea ferrariae TaxID=1386098 RepID=UPI001C8C882C